ncbi:MAG: hypothetical protein ABR499_13775 [Gemmatimonadaceae bacterium]
MIARIRRFALTSLAAAGAALAAAPLWAQQASPTPVGPDPAARHQAVPAGPTVDRAAVGVRPLSQETDSLADPFAQQRRAGLGRPVALMVVGFGAVVVGLLIGDDVGTLIAVVGAAVGLYGLYHYLK